MTMQKQDESVKEMMALVVEPSAQKHKNADQKQEAESMSETNSTQPKRKHETDKSLASSIAKMPKKEVQPVPVLKKKRAGESMDSSSISNKKLKTENEKDLLASLPLYVSFMILDKLMEPFDHLRLALVCKEWSSISKLYNESTQRWCSTKGNLLPLFLERTETNPGSGLQAYTVSDKIRRYDNVPSPVANGKRCCGSSHGWLASVDLEGKCLRIVLTHAFQKSVDSIRLPPLKLTMTDVRKYQEYIEKVVLSSDPNTNPNNYLVIVLYGYQGSSKLAFIKGGEDSKWSYVDRRICSFKDAIFYRNQVYTVKGADKQKQRIMSFDVNGPPKVRQASRAPKYKGGARINNSYLVESACGEHLWHIRRLDKLSKRIGINEKFKVYKLVFDAQDGSVVEQVEVESIGDEALFVGVSHSMAVLASNFPGMCKPNSIYYTNNDLHGYQEPKRRRPYRIFTLDEGTITRYRNHSSERPEKSWGVWVLPMFKGLC